MATSIRMTIAKKPGMEGVEVHYSCEAIVDGPDDAKVQGGEVARLIDAFENGFKEALPDD